MEELYSENQSVVVAEELPVVEDTEEKSVVNRVGKIAGKVLNTEWFGEFDLFGNPLTLNYEGQENHKTEFGGIIFIIVATITVTLTVIYMFPNGMVINSVITEYSLVQDGGKGMTLFDHTDCFMRMFYWNKTANGVIKGDALRWLVVNLTAYQVMNISNETTIMQLDVIPDYDNGYFYLNNTAENANATLYQSGEDSVTIRVEPLICDLFQTHQIYGMCFMTALYGGNALGADFATFLPKSNGIIERRVASPVNPMQSSFVKFDASQFTTNNKFFGYISNIFSHEIDYFVPWPDMYIDKSAPSYYDQSYLYSSYADTCFTWGMNFRCSIFDIRYSGTTTIATERFDDITAPMLFFISLIQTLFFLVYFFFLSNYSNNAFKLDLADQLVYISDPEGRHYNFKSGALVFLTCLWHKHWAVTGLDYLLYRFWETHSRKFLPTLMQLTMDMIDYGEGCLSDDNFYGELNDIYSQENAQPSKIIFDYEKQQREESEEKEEEEEPDCYFDDEVREEAFKRMCEDHEYHSVERKKYLRDLLLETDKRYKLVLIAQDLFEGYCTRVRNEGHVKEIELPITYQNEELSGHNLKKENFY